MRSPLTYIFIPFIPLVQTCPKLRSRTKRFYLSIARQKEKMKKLMLELIIYLVI